MVKRVGLYSVLVPRPLPGAGWHQRRILIPIKDEIDRRQKLYERIARRIVSAFDPDVWVSCDDGETVEGPTVSLYYPNGAILLDETGRSHGPFHTNLTLDQQESMLERLFEIIRGTDLHDKWIPVFVRVSDGANYPHIEIPCDTEHHRRMMFTLASMPPDQRDDYMRALGISPAVARLTQDIFVKKDDEVV